MRTVITTVGTSLLTNRDETDTLVRRPWEGWRRSMPLPGQDEAVRYLDQADMKQASAETNTLESLPLYEDDRIVFLYSDTKEGEWCASALSVHFQNRRHDRELLRISGLGYQEMSFAERGLKIFIDHTFRIINRDGADRVVLCATGGFKAEIAFANLIGMMTQIPVFYIHEHFRELVELPRIPIKWDLSIVEDNLPFFEWIDEEPRISADVESRLKANPSLRPFASESEDGYTYLSVVGDLLFKAYHQQTSAGPRATWPPASPLQPKEKIRLSGEAHHRPQGWEQFVDKLSAVDCISLIHYDENGPHSAARTEVYRRNPEDGVFGLVYKRGDQCLPLRVETTAQTNTQLDLILEYLQRRIRKW